MPAWAGEDGAGYSWVEVWDGEWHFLSAHNFTTGDLDDGWFYPEPGRQGFRTFTQLPTKRSCYPSLVWLL